MGRPAREGFVLTERNFASFGLAQPLLDALARTGFTTPTPIQAQAIAPQMEGRDILGVAQTGTGKTAAFGLPILHHILDMPGRPAPKTCRALILAPTRELAVQIEQSFRSFAGGARLTTLLILGGMSRNNQIRMMGRGVDVVVATPGRLIDLIERGAIDLSQTGYLVLDEADQMLDIGFIHALRRIARTLPRSRQTLLFSATMPKLMEELASTYLTNPVRVQANPPGRPADKIEQGHSHTTGNGTEFTTEKYGNNEQRDIAQMDQSAIGGNRQIAGTCTHRSNLRRLQGGHMLHGRRRIDDGRRISAHALDDAHLSFGFSDFQFGHIGFRYQINQGFEFSQIHGSSNG